MIIGVTASSKGLTEQQLNNIEADLKFKYTPPSSLVHGDCIGGDCQIARLAYAIGYTVVSRPGYNPRFPTSTDKRAFATSHLIHEPEPFLQRNDKIVNDAQVLIGAPFGPEDKFPRSGVWYTIRRARKKGIPVWLYWPDGKVQYSGDIVGTHELLLQ